MKGLKILCLGHTQFKYRYCVTLLLSPSPSVILLSHILFVPIVQGGSAFVRTSASSCWNSFLSCGSMGTSPMTCNMKTRRCPKSFLPTSRLKSCPCSARKRASSSRRVLGSTSCHRPNYALTCRIKNELGIPWTGSERSVAPWTRVHFGSAGEHRKWVRRASQKQNPKHFRPSQLLFAENFFILFIFLLQKTAEMVFRNEGAGSEHGLLFSPPPPWIFSTLLRSHHSF